MGIDKIRALRRAQIAAKTFGTKIEEERE